ncbi:MAG: hypothetical protein M3Q97_10885 [Bacteroidota bacterium]|nr:hypothetical protein [Bacteroidota bacterium]
MSIEPEPHLDEASLEKAAMAYHILVITSTLEGDFDIPKGKQITHYILRQFPGFHKMMPEESRKILSMPSEDLAPYFYTSIKRFSDIASEQEKLDLINTIFRVLTITNPELSEEHQQVYSAIAEVFGIDIKTMLE